MTSRPERWKESEETTRAGLVLVVLKSVKGKATRTTSPRLKSVIYRVVGVVPEGKGFFGRLQAGTVFGGKEDGGQIPQELSLFLGLELSKSFFNSFECHILEYIISP